jgi:hypothetical protein
MIEWDSKYPVQTRPMLNMDKMAFPFPCPGCNFQNRATFQQVRTAARLICRGCKREIQLGDRRSSFKKAKNEIPRELEALTPKMQIDINL